MSLNLRGFAPTVPALGMLVGVLAVMMPSLMPGAISAAHAQSPLIALDAPTGAIIAFDAQGVGTPLASTGLTGITGAKFGPDGLLYVVDSSTSAVYRFHPISGASLGAFVAPGSGGLASPQGLTWGPGGDLFVTHMAVDARVNRYDGLTGAFESVFVGPFTPQPRDVHWGADGNLYLTCEICRAVKRYDGLTGQSAGLLVMNIPDGPTLPRGFAFGPEGRVYVTSQSPDNAIRVYSSTGAFLRRITAPGLTNPRTVEFTSDGTMYVGGTFNGTGAVVAFDANENFAGVRASGAGLVSLAWAAVMPCFADVDRSGFVDSDDFVAYLDAFARGCEGPGVSLAGPDGACVLSADFDGSGFIDSDDFVAFAAKFAAGC
jgi:DNA-binding beta-propeller fold protein YncE